MLKKETKITVNPTPGAPYTYKSGSFIRRRPKMLDCVLNNPGIGFMTFQRNDSGRMNAELLEKGYVDDYGDHMGSDNMHQLPIEDYPHTTIAYYREYWRYLEPKDGEFSWHLFDKAIERAESRGQGMYLTIMPYGWLSEDVDVPTWYREMIGPVTEREMTTRLMCDPNDPRYLEYFGRAVREFAKRYDGHPRVQAVDISIVGAWGEAGGIEYMPFAILKKFADVYLESFEKTPLINLLTDYTELDRYIGNRAKALGRRLGWRMNSYGDTSWYAGVPWQDVGWNHMDDFVPRVLAYNGYSDLWKTGPISQEICDVFETWEKDGIQVCDWRNAVDESYKWHISSINGKSSKIPAKWRGLVDEWLKRMGYRFALRKFFYWDQAIPGRELTYNMWFDNRGNAPCYRQYPLAIKLESNEREILYKLGYDITEWLPGDKIIEDSVMIPKDTPLGVYKVSVAILDLYGDKPIINLASEGRGGDGWYDMGFLEIVESLGEHWPAWGRLTPEGEYGGAMIQGSGDWPASEA